MMTCRRPEIAKVKADPLVTRRVCEYDLSELDGKRRGLLKGMAVSDTSIGVG